MKIVQPERVKVSVAAQMLGVSPLTVRRGIYAGRIPSIKTDTGRRFIPMAWVQSQIGGIASSADVRCAIYARESSSENRTALLSQVDGLTRFAQAKGYTIVHVVKEIGSGVNDTRKKLMHLLEQKDFDILLVEHKDRLTRFGFNWFSVLCPFKIEVVNQAEDADHDLMEDLIAVITSFCARLYGQRRGRLRTEAAIKAIKE